MEEKDRTDPERTDATPPRLPYEPPQIEQEETFETLALACAKAPRGAGCGAGRS